jgi:hypothetical protein
MRRIALPVTTSDLPKKSSNLLAQRIITTTSRLILFGLVAAATILVLYRHPTIMSYNITNTPLYGWHSRAQPLAGRFVPSKEAFSFASLRNAPVDPEGFNAGFFAPDIVVDARGVVLKLNEQDWQGITDLAQRAVTELPQTGAFRNQWRIRHPRTSYPIDWLQVNVQTEDFKQIAVYGFDPREDTLDPPVGDYTSLPPILKELFGVLGEARDGYVKGEEDTVMINQVKAVADT